MSKKTEKNQVVQKFQLKTPKGTRDFDPKMMTIKDHLFKTIISNFKKYGAEEIDTPVFELKETLTGKYGEDSKLIYDLVDQGGEILALRYDLTVPFARYLAQNKVDKIKRYHIAKVYRRDNPVMTKGRFREFYQCDYDIAGLFDPMLPDVEVLQVTIEILNQLNIGDFFIKINHRKIIDSMLFKCGVPSEQVRAVSSSIDKLDKVPWEEVYKELVDVKNIPSCVCDKIKIYVQYKGGIGIFKEFSKDFAEEQFKDFNEGFNDLLLLDEYASILGIENKFIYDMSLARGLDYYTGLIYEVVMKDESLQVGSIAAGGRYDNLVGMFSRTKRQIPCVGISLGVERIYTILENKLKREQIVIKSKKIDILVASAQKNLINERLKLVKLLRDNNYNVEFIYKLNPKLLNQFQYCEDHNIPFCLIIGEDELKNDIVIIRNMKLRQDIKVKRDQLIEFLEKELLRYHMENMDIK